MTTTLCVWGGFVNQVSGKLLRNQSNYLTIFEKLCEISGFRCGVTFSFVCIIARLWLVGVSGRVATIYPGCW
jgi:hypothetical protein